jgi:phage shock protein E
MGRQQAPRSRPTAPSKGARPRAAAQQAKPVRVWPWIIGGVVALAVIVAVALLLTGGGGADKGKLVSGNGGSWTDITPDRLATEMKAKDFTLLNVKTPYIGEIDGTDLYIPYDQLASRASELPADKTAKIVVYCRSGNESTIASQTLLDLGYTNIENLAGGMNAWTSSGRQVVNLGRS